jgi:hypothetical protein
MRVDSLAPAVAPLVPVTKGDELKPIGLGGKGFTPLQHPKSAVSAVLLHLDALRIRNALIQGIPCDRERKYLRQVFMLEARPFQQTVGLSTKNRGTRFWNSAAILIHGLLSLRPSDRGGPGPMAL